MDALIVRHSCMGDIVCAEPVARLMKKLYESVSFDAGPYAEIFENHPDLTDISLLKEHQIFDLTHVYFRRTFTEASVSVPPVTGNLLSSV